MQNNSHAIFNQFSITLNKSNSKLIITYKTLINYSQSIYYIYISIRTASRIRILVECSRKESEEKKGVEVATPGSRGVPVKQREVQEDSKVEGERETEYDGLTPRSVCEEQMAFCSYFKIQPGGRGCGSD